MTRILLAPVLVLVLVACPSTRPSEPKSSAASTTQPERTEVRPTAELLRNLPSVASEGGCEPRYQNGLTGTCINGQPCRGLGVRDDSGAARCICFARDGGCSSGERCDVRLARCVPESAHDLTRER